MYEKRQYDTFYVAARMFKNGKKLYFLAQKVGP